MGSYQGEDPGDILSAMEVYRGFSTMICSDDLKGYLLCRAELGAGDGGLNATGEDLPGGREMLPLTEWEG